MKWWRSCGVLFLLLVHPARSHAQLPEEGTVTGSVSDSSTHEPLESASVTLRSRSDTTRIVGTTTAKSGAFTFSRVPFGAYNVECAILAHARYRSRVFVLSAANPRMDLGAIALKPSALLLHEVVVTSEKYLFDHAADRRIYNVDHDVMAKSSSVSDLLQNIPSVQVDIDGGVSLRGSSDVMILINGRKSPLMGRSRADVLQQLPAAGVERIEVITNPSARFTPEGASGIINIVTKKGAGGGIHRDVTGHIGAADRHNENLALGYKPGKLDLFGNYGYRDDQRRRLGTDARAIVVSGSPRSDRERDDLTTLPEVNAGTLGLNYRPDAKNTWELSGDYLRRRPVRDGLSTIVSQADDGTILSDYDRVRTGFELDVERSATGAFEHDFAKENHTLRIEATGSDMPHTEDAQFVEHWRTPSQPDPASDIALHQAERLGNLSLDYANPLDAHARLEAGYALELHRQDIRSDADSLDVAQRTLHSDPAKTYRFRLNQRIQAVYGTYQRTLGKLTALAGVRLEYARISSDLVTGGAPFTDIDSGLYPTLHLTWQASARGQLLASYSRRIRRPESDDLNPFPEFTDPYNIDAGNPRLIPESIHSYELGYSLRGDHSSFAPTLYLRDRSQGFTRLTQVLNDSTFLRTMVNLAHDRSAGLEPVVTLSIGRTLQANINGNVFYEQIDASNLGYAGTRSVVSWSGTANATVVPWTAGTLEWNANYRSPRLTPQGESRPSFTLNVGARQNFARDRFTFTLAISDLLKTQRQDTQLDVSGIQQQVTNKRDAQIVYAGLTYHYGRPDKRDRKDRAIQFEDQP
jgi:outer membrane receptor protein involved in Fe transport